MTSPDSILEAIRSRRSIRQFTERKPTRTEIEQLIEAACWAPSSHNRQGWKFIVFVDKDVIDDLALRASSYLRGRSADCNMTRAEQLEEMVHYAGLFKAAPVLILAMHKKSPVVGRQVLEFATSPLASGEALSAAMAVQNLCLAAYALGMGACVMTAPLLAGEVWKSLPDLPAGFEPTCLIALGFPSHQPEPPRRKPLIHVVEYR